MSFRSIPSLSLCLSLFCSATACSDDNDGDNEMNDMAGTEAGGGDESEGESDDDDNGSGGGGGGGSTDCTPPGFEDSPTLCQAGQYCADSTLANCEAGCLSNQNCSDDQGCEIPAGASEGVCVNQGSAVAEEDFCEKFLSCEPSATAALCGMVYAATNGECHQCFLAENCGDISDFDGACDDACGL